ncbi:hypothetical protein [Streptomyces sp. NPDC102437]|uniref:hypothetical protein n=1 Tax=Streptomyces sp. NPDC102437 TaxID=3366175 RepID=UPI0038072A3C
MIQHMNLVFQAGGLKTGEGAFLMACANHTDNRGYVIAHMKQLADEAHMTLRAAQDNRARLEVRGLLKSKERLNPKNRAQMANLFRINLDKLAAMKRSKTDYGPTLIEELTFDAADAPPEENPSSDPHADSAPPPADSAPPHAESAGDGDADSAPLLLPSSVPSSLSGSGRPSGDGSVQDEREAAAPEGMPAVAEAGVPGPREDTDGLAEVVAMLAGLPRSTEAVALKLAPLAAAGVAAGWTVPELRAHLVRNCDVERVRYAPAVYEMHLRQLPAPSKARPEQRPGREMCERHPAFAADDCSPCRRAEMDRQQRGASEPGPVDGMGLLARVRAGQSAGGAQ